MIRARIASVVVALTAVPLALVLSLTSASGPGDLRATGDAPVTSQPEAGEDSGIWGP
ncbi:hypothetical protein [Streptomyces sp. NPDC056600]|uniref:hypothetical protein n=1 Tax=Streptomyces sp. NPDC056600 TaxID=3345874 RepID=UPI0036A00637